MLQNRRLLASMVLLLAQLACSAHKFEFPSIKILNDHANDASTLVLLDLDNTVFDINTDRWFARMIEHARSLGHDTEGAVKAVVPHYLKRVAEATVKPAEPDTVDVITALQQRGVPVNGLTSRGHMLADTTRTQLSSIGVDFTKSSITPYNISFSLKEPAAFRDGIMYCAQNGKKEALKALLNATAYKPKKIIMVDDKDHYVNEVIEAGKELGIEVVGIRYSQLDQKLKEFQLDHESKQLLKPPASKLIVEHTTIDAVKQYLVPGAVVIFDIDETVMRLQHDHQYGSSKWLQKLIQFASVEHGCGQEDIDRLILPHYYTAQEQAPVCAVEAHTVAFIKELQQTKVPVMALTARRLEVMEPTLRNLRALGIDFSVTAPLKEPTSFAINHPNLFIEGIMFCGGVQRTKENEKAVHAKDRAIKALFRHCNLKPTRVVVVDDNPAYLESIVDTIVSMGIDCVGIRYGACDHLRNTCVLDEASKDLVRSYVAAKAQEA